MCTSILKVVAVNETSCCKIQLNINGSLMGKPDRMINLSRVCIVCIHAPIYNREAYHEIRGGEKLLGETCCLY